MEVKDKTVSSPTKRISKNGLKLGRPSGTGKFGETTTAIRVPTRMIGTVKEWVHSMLKEPSFDPMKQLIAKLNHQSMEVGRLVNDSTKPLSLFANKVAAGFPSPGDDYLEKKLDLNEYVIKNPNTTFYVRVIGDSMQGAQIFEGDILVVDRGLDAVDGKVVIAVINGEMTVKRLRLKGDSCFLEAENEQYPPIEVKQENDFLIWGVVTHVIHTL